MIKKYFIVSIIVSLFISGLFAEERYSIDYYGIVATEIDANMSKMTSDLYYTQLCEINNFVINTLVKFAIDAGEKSLINCTHQGVNSDEAVRVWMRCKGRSVLPQAGN